METKVDVLVIGAGPAGLMCAQGLKRAGVDVRIIDQRYVLDDGQLCGWRMKLITETLVVLDLERSLLDKLMVFNPGLSKSFRFVYLFFLEYKKYERMGFFENA